MRKAKYKWKLKEQEVLPQSFIQLLNQQKIDPFIGQLLWQRNLRNETALKKFLSPTLEDIYDPLLMNDMKKAIQRIQTAVENGERILIYGDYDTDGITSTVLMKEAIESIGGDVDFFLPNRFIHGYGPNKEIFKEKIEQGIQLIITVDNGVAGHEAIQLAQEKGVDVIITDHHELPVSLPQAYAIVHPRHPDGKYPFDDLAGVGVAFKVASALLEEPPVEFLDLVALGTIADLVSLTDENRVLVKIGLVILQKSERIGLKCLIEKSGLKQETISEEDIGFSLAPRLNAIGRLGEAGPGVQLLATFDDQEAEQLATMIDEKNNQRKKLVSTVTEEALQQINPNDPIHIIAKEEWPEGILGIVAGKIVQETGKPTIVLTIDAAKKLAKGSARSIPAINLYEVLNEKRAWLTSFGGHAMAAGLTLSVENIILLKEYLFYCMKQQTINLDEKQEILIDMPIPVAEVSLALIKRLQLLAPFGTKNAAPLFLFQDSMIQNVQQIGVNNNHLKFQLKDKQLVLDAIAFQMGKDKDEFSNTQVTIVGKLGINEWRGNCKPQVLVTDFMVKNAQLFDLRGKKGFQYQWPVDHTAYICFKKESQQFIQDIETNIFVYPELPIKSKVEQLIFIDCPDRLEDIKRIVQQLNVKRVYLICNSEEEAYLNGMGTRDQFGKLYKFIQQHKQVDLTQLPEISKYLKIKEKLLTFMIQVFFELEFVTIKDDHLKVIENPKKQSLTESTSYQERLKKIKTEEFLLYSSLNTLQQWLWNEEE
ncbi:single-stranded-DNA-specific exonuclease RecJ [Melissococcus plutonius]|uniref:Single-stranded-DNA-specific exonuclease RecJ n=1 Tax=Melissococcus plutonius TaxID=33970 RepID=A0A2Z5Y2G2_9ENTE|nr:single-stranded-DNA-specific exonuclease RecJ [Melissococcus plutonius]BAL62056.1 single-stranded-DNA-specific exonuclease RecJ [Melissococcus plutonius DAT561]MCV2499180.1 single-stranded-DNA-specific exonuclease RecJ [Melissococcus plutonius]MCV2500366.1 single-stranded-DNA-specific exonuclease RecJ [Melissococcus plutonius]MCV2505159.1 single-stranded-DNA-specific exonuclease RecJ [Melissococcus plutonius]MCV2507685.1 single-stranded-DNA-specific exonuclease RecJ [Melissococcus plutonius